VPHFELKEVRPTEKIIRVDVTGAHCHIGKTLVTAVIAEALAKAFGDTVDIVVQNADSDYAFAAQRLIDGRMEIAGERIVVVDSNGPFQIPEEEPHGLTFHMNVVEDRPTKMQEEGQSILDTSDCPAVKDGI